MKMLSEYLDRAVEFEKLAASEQNEAFKAELLKQAAAYRKLADKLAHQYGLNGAAVGPNVRFQDEADMPSWLGNVCK